MLLWSLPAGWVSLVGLVNGNAFADYCRWLQIAWIGFGDFCEQRLTEVSYRRPITGLSGK
jgi:hypothetical protein